MLVSGLPCCGHAQWLGFAGGHVVLQLGFWGQLILTCILAFSTVLGDFAPCPLSLSGKYEVGIMVPLFFVVWWCLVFAAHRVVMVTLCTQLLCSRLHYLSRYLPQAHLLLMSLIKYKFDFIVLYSSTDFLTNQYNINQNIIFKPWMVDQYSDSSLKIMNILICFDLYKMYLIQVAKQA